MRTSNRSKILDAAVRVINRDGMGALTFESVSLEAGLTRGGLLYHFPSREAMVAAINEHLADRWEAGLEELAGGPATEAGAQQRHVAYVRGSSDSASRAELMFMLDSTSPDAAAPWIGALERWAPPVPEHDADNAVLDQFIARLAVDGLWIYEAMSHGRIDPAVRARLVERITQMFDLPDGPAKR